jgi:hypothetical protein
MRPAGFCTAYALEAKDIQTYILDRTRMREMVGASGLVDAISASLLDTVLATLKLQEGTDFAFCRRGAGGFTLLLADIGLATRLLNLFALLLPQYAPGLVFVAAVAEGDSSYQALQNLRIALARNRQTPAASLPPGTPLAQRALRTGRVANAWQHSQPQDRESLAKSKFARGNDRLSDKFDPARRHPWPIELNPKECADNEYAFPFRDDSAYVGILHIDGNGLGQALHGMREAIRDDTDYAALEYAFSQLIENVACQAAQRASAACLLPLVTLANPSRYPSVYPARPLVLGGDDLTMIVRADVALDFARHFILAWEQASATALAQFQAASITCLNLPHHFTACAGLVFVRAKYPFYLAYQTCESLCDRAKRLTKAAAAKTGMALVPSALAFGRITTHLAADYGADEQLRLESSVYAVGEQACADLPALAALDGLLEFASHADQPTGKRSLVELHSLLGQGQGQGATSGQGAAGGTHSDAAQRYQRWKEVLHRRDPNALTALLALLAKLGSLEADLPVIRKGAQRFSPIGDVLALMAVQGPQRTEQKTPPGEPACVK